MARTIDFSRGHIPGARGRCRGTVLLEVVLALVLFVAAATVITGGLNASVREVERLRLNTHANNLAASVLAEMRLGIKAVESSGPNVFEPPFESWSWETKVAAADDKSVEADPLQNVEIVVRHQKEPVVRRMGQFLPAAKANDPDQGNGARSSGLPLTETRDSEF